MHPGPVFHWDNPSAVRSFVRARGFGMLVMQGMERLQVAHIPFILDDGDRILFHLSRANALAKLPEGGPALLIVNGPDAYISPDFYDIPDQVPTWNYVAVELAGSLRRLDEDELLAQIDAVSEEQEKRLLPKPVWTRHKMTDGLVEKMLKAIVGFEMTVTDICATAKLGQNKPESVRLCAADHLDRGGHGEMAAWMRKLPE